MLRHGQKNASFQAQKLRDVAGVTLLLDLSPGFVDQRQGFRPSAAGCQAAGERALQPHDEKLEARCAKLFQPALQDVDAGLDLAAADRKLTLEGVTKVKIGLQ